MEGSLKTVSDHELLRDLSELVAQGYSCMYMAQFARDNCTRVQLDVEQRE